MSDLNFLIDVDDTKLRLRLEELPRKLQARLKVKIGELTHQLLRQVQAREPVSTGRLRRQTRAYVDDNRVKNFVRGRVRILPVQEGINRTAAAFGALEYGSTGKKFPVKGYRRRGGNVSAYARRGGIRERRFLRGSMALMAPRARVELQRLLGETVKE